MKNFKNVHVGKSTVVLTSVAQQEKTKPITIKIDPANQEAQDEIMPWGSNNLYPQDFYNKKYLNNGAAVGGIKALKSTHHGNGFALTKEVRDVKTGEVKPVRQLLSDFPEIKEFVRVNRLNRFWFEKITDQSLFQISFTEHVVTPNFAKITRVKRHKAAHCRFAKMNEAGVIPFVYINTDWSSNDPKFTVKLPYMDPDMSAEDIREYCKAKKVYNFITSSCHPLVDESFYPKADWHAVDRNGWMDVANSVPELKKYLFEQQMHFKYIVYVSDFYFESFYKEEWEDFDSDKRQQMREDLAAIIDDHMSGNKAAGRSLTAPIFEDGGKYVEGIKVVPVDNKLKDGSYLPDASAANMEILHAIGVDPTIIGANISGSLGAGSGSDKREAYTILSARLTPERNITLEDWELWRDFNGWDSDLEGTFPNVNLTTLDKNPNGQVEVIR